MEITLETDEIWKLGNYVHEVYEDIKYVISGIPRFAGSLRKN